MDERMNDDEEEGQKSFVIKDDHERTPEQQIMMGELVGDLAIENKRIES